MKMGEKLTFVNFIKRITDGWVKIFFRQDVMGGVGGSGQVHGCPGQRGKRLSL